MTKRHDNMLEAFRESTRIEETKPVPQPRPGEALSFSGSGERVPPAPEDEGTGAETPVRSEAAMGDGAESDAPATRAPRRKAVDDDLVGVTGRSAPAATPPERASKPDRGTRVTIPVGREWFFGLTALALTLVFMLGRWSAGTVAAAGPGDDTTLAAAVPGAAARGDLSTRPASTTRNNPGSLAAPAQDSEQAGGQADARGQVALTAAGRAFLDPTNIFTVVAITYDDSDAGRDLAVSTYRHLEAAGFDVVYPRRKSGKLLIFVGASAGYRDLESVEGELRRTRGPNGRLPFTGAYRVNIADYR